MKRKLFSILLTLCMVMGLFPMSALAADAAFSDTSGHWAADAIETWAVYEVLKGSDGQFRPDDPITRAELAAVLNRVIGYTESSGTFTDVPSEAWYYSDVAKLYAAGIMMGDGAGTMRPTANITREEAVVLIARVFHVEENAGNEAPFPDAGSISGWASFLVDGMKAAGYISGDTAGKFNPKTSITRAEVVTILDNMITLFFNTAGEHDCELIGEIDANALINTAGAAIKNLTINGNLWVTEGVGSGDVTLDNVTVSGITYIRGGGPNSIHVTGGSFGEIRLNAGTHPALKLLQETEVGRIYLDNTATATHDGVTVSYDAATGTITYGGEIDKVELNADGTATITIGGMVCAVIPPEGTVSKFELAKDAVVKQLVLDAGVTISGEGTIEKASVNSDGAIINKSVNVKPENITVADGVEISIGDKKYIGEGTALPNEKPVSSGSGGQYTPTPVGVDLTEVSFTPPDTVTVGDLLTAAAVPENATNIRYQWYMSESDNAITAPNQAERISGATSATFTVTDAQGGKYIYVAVTGKNNIVKVSGKTVKVSSWIKSVTLEELQDLRECDLKEEAEVITYDSSGVGSLYTLKSYVLKEVLAELGADMNKLTPTSELLVTDTDGNSVIIPYSLIVDDVTYIAVAVEGEDGPIDTAPHIFPAPNFRVSDKGVFVDEDLCLANIVSLTLYYE